MKIQMPKSPVKRKAAKTKLPFMRKSVKLWDRKKVMEYVMLETVVTDKGLDKILKSAPYDMPNERDVRKWIAEDKELRHEYVRAREARVEFMEDEILNISDNAGQVVMVDDVPMTDHNGEPMIGVDAASVAKAKLQIDTRKWIMAKLKPNKYGDSVKVEGAGSLTPNGTVNNLTINFVKADAKEIMGRSSITIEQEPRVIKVG